MSIRMSSTQYDFLFVTCFGLDYACSCAKQFAGQCPEPWPWAEYNPGLISTILTFTIIQGEIVWRKVRSWLGSESA